MRLFQLGKRTQTIYLGCEGPFNIAPGLSQISWRDESCWEPRRHCLLGLCGSRGMGYSGQLQLNPGHFITQHQSSTNFKVSVSRSAQDLPVIWAQGLIRLSWSAWFPLRIISREMLITNRKVGFLWARLQRGCTIKSFPSPLLQPLSPNTPTN